MRPRQLEVRSTKGWKGQREPGGGRDTPVDVEACLTLPARPVSLSHLNKVEWSPYPFIRLFKNTYYGPGMSLFPQGCKVKDRLCLLGAFRSKTENWAVGTSRSNSHSLCERDGACEWSGR